jgi:hypothetical protein
MKESKLVQCKNCTGLGVTNVCLHKDNNYVRRGYDWDKLRYCKLFIRKEVKK